MGKGWNQTPDLLTSSHASLVSRESVRIALTHAALLLIETMAADIRNTYLQATIYKMDYIICVPEFEIDNFGRVALIRRALYGVNVAGRDFWIHLRKCTAELGFESLKADPDVWFRSSKTQE